ncbi:MAG: OmpA family protein, partial [Rubellimicrobium sp.]|nr:OmpA family protein [Rubellimicrobium sp.]
GVSMIGLIPARTVREALNLEFADIAAGQEGADLLQSADYPVPPGWEPALDYALRSLRNLPRSKISVSAGHVAIHAISESENHRRRLETELARTAPQGVRLGLTISAPRPVITPFTLRFTLDEDGARFDACAADDEEAVRTITAAATAAGMTGPLDCTLALGVPTSRWADGVAMAIGAVAELGSGTVTFSDVDIVLAAPEGTDQRLFDEVIGALSNRLPQVFALEAILPRPPEAGAEGPPEFTMSLSSEGIAQLRGRVPDELMNNTLANFAGARFGNDNVVMATRIAPEGLPPGWSIRVLAGIEALVLLNNGTVVVSPDKVVVRGDTGNEDANAEITRLLIEKLGQSADFQIDVTYVRELDPVVGLPTAEECIYMIGVVTDGRKITFDPGSATLTSGTIPIIDDIAEVLRRCAALRLRIAGHTDSQGRTEMNLRLSQQRADSVLAALRARRVPVSGFEAVGYGPEFPIADNATEEGREANRRIEFTLILPEAETAEDDETEAVEGEETEAADAAAVAGEAVAE